VSNCRVKRKGKASGESVTKHCRSSRVSSVSKLRTVGSPCCFPNLYLCQLMVAEATMCIGPALPCKVQLCACLWQASNIEPLTHLRKEVPIRIKPEHHKQEWKVALIGEMDAPISWTEEENECSLLTLPPPHVNVFTTQTWKQHALLI
jgi:hypothetical protein